MQHTTPDNTSRIKTLILWVTVFGQASIALYLPALPLISHDLAISSIMAKQTITAFIIGFGISPILYGPLSDRYGRKPIVLFSLALACVGYVINCFAQSIELFIIARVIQGLGCGGILVGGRSIVRDVFSGRALSSASSYLSMGFAIGFGASPTIGGYMTTYFGWRADFILLASGSFIMLAAVIFYLPETHTKAKNAESLKEFIHSVFINYRIILTNYKFLKFLMGGFFAYGVVITYNVMTPFLMQHAFHISPIQYGYLALLMGASYYLAAHYNKKLALKLGTGPIFKLGYLLVLLSGILLLVLHLVLKQNIYYVAIPLVFAMFGQGLIFSNTISGALHQFPAESAGKVSAIFSSGQIILVSFLSAVIALLPSSSALPIAIILIVLGLGCMGFLFNVKES